MPPSLLQKPNKSSKSKDHAKSLERRFDIYKEGSIDGIFKERKAVQDRLDSENKTK